MVEIPLSELHSFKGHPFKVKDDDAMMETTDSIRHRASELAEKETMPVIVRDLDDDAATIIMVDSNLQRESLLPSERAFAYKMKLEAMKRQAGRPSKENCSQVGNDFGKKSSEVLAGRTAGKADPAGVLQHLHTPGGWLQKGGQDAG